MYTIKDVARVAGVSIGTVSNVLSGNRKVLEEKKKRVLQAIDQLGYVPNRGARALKTKQASCIGIVMPEIISETNSQIVTAAEEVCRKYGYQLVVNVAHDAESEKKILETAMQGMIAGMIVCTNIPDSRELFAKITEDIPAVFVQREVKGGNYDYFRFNNYDLVYQTMQELIEKNHYRTAIITGKINYSAEEDCIKGYTACIKNNKLPLDDRLISPHNFNRTDAYRTTISLLQMENPPSAFIVSSELLAEGVTDAINDTRANIFNSFQIVALCGENEKNCYTQGDVLRLSRPALEMGRRAAQQLMENLDAKYISDRRQIDIAAGYTVDKHLISDNRPQVVVEPMLVRDTLKILLYDCPAARAVCPLKTDLYVQKNINAEIDFKGAFEIYQTMLDGGGDYDIVMLDTGWIDYLAAGGFIADISDLMADVGIETELFHMESLRECEPVEHKYYGIPWQRSEQTLFYRKDLFENETIRKIFRDECGAELRTPTNWLEFNVMSRFFTREYNGISPAQFGTSFACKEKPAIITDILSRIWAYGSDCFDANGTVVLEKGAVAQALQNYKEGLMYAAGTSLQNSVADQVNDFISGNTAFVICPSFMGWNITDRVRSNVADKTAAANIPGKNIPYEGWALCLNASGKKRESAFAFLKWIFEKNNPAKITGLGGFVPVNTVFEARETRYPYLWLKRDAGDYSVPRKNFEKKALANIRYDEAEIVLAKMVWDYLDGAMDADRAADAARQQLRQLKLRAAGDGEK